MNLLILLLGFILMCAGMYYLFVEKRTDQAALCFALEANILVWYGKRK